MSYLIISNDSFYDKDYYSTFVNQQEYRFFNVSTGSSTLFPMYQELLRNVLGDKVDENFKDFPLSTEQAQELKTIFEAAMEVLLEDWKPTGKPPHKDIVYKDSTYALDLRLTSPKDRRINDIYQIISICEECLDEEKPMYLSIESDA